MHRDDDPAVLAWIVSQHTNGATIVGVCSGARVLSRAVACRTTARSRRDGPLVRFQHTAAAEPRYALPAGPPICGVTTTGVSASLPVSLALVEAIGDADSARALARELGVSRWDQAHPSASFQRKGFLYRSMALTAMQCWRRERIELPVSDGVDEVALAFTADGSSRTYRFHAMAVRAEGDSDQADKHDIATRGGLVIVTDARRSSAPVRVLPGNVPAAAALDRALTGTGVRYGDRTASLVALQLEYARAP